MGQRARERTVEPELREEPASRTPQPVPKPHELTPESVLAMQRGAGNAAVARLLSQRSRPVLAREPEIEPTDVAMGQRVVDDLRRVNNKKSKSATTGVHYAHNYARLAETDLNAGARWDVDYWHGYANPAFWDRKAHMAWQLKPGVDAAAAIQDWLNGLTIAECASVLVAIELDTMRAAIGDNRFNEMFSSLHGQPEKTLLRISQYPQHSSTAGFMKQIGKPKRENEQPGRRSVKKGEWHYVFNHPKYLLKHPEGAFQGENSVCMDDRRGKQKWSGFGVNSCTEAEMLQTMANAYNAQRTERDYEWLVKEFAPDKAQAKTKDQTWKHLYDSMWFWEIGKEYLPHVGFPETITAQDILDAPEYTVKDVTRKGGFVEGGGKKLDAEAVAQEREEAQDTEDTEEFVVL